MYDITKIAQLAYRYKTKYISKCEHKIRKEKNHEGWPQYIKQYITSHIILPISSH